jgi:electron transfer flavoprotein beta subunit
VNILVVLRMVPDVVEEFEIGLDGKSLDLGFARMVLSESDDHALEQALVIKERDGGTVTVLALDAPEIDEVLFAALAKGTDRAVKITGAEQGVTTREAAHVIAQVISSEPGLKDADLVLTGTQAINDLDGLMAPLLGHELGLPFLGIVTRLVPDPSARVAMAMKEFPHGTRGEFEVALPAVFGIQAAEKPPRYVPVAKVRAVMKAKKIDCLSVESPTATEEPGLSLLNVLAMRKPEAAGHAEILQGSAQETADALCAILAERGLL